MATSAQRLGNYAQDIVQAAFQGPAYARMWLGRQIDAALPEDRESPLRRIWTLMQTHGSTIVNALWIAGILYTFYQAPIFFLASVGVGFLASSQLLCFILPAYLQFPSLQKGEVLATAEEDDQGRQLYPAQLTFFYLACINWYVGQNFFEDIACGAISGLLLGNNLYHHMDRNRAKIREFVTSLFRRNPPPPTNPDAPPESPAS